MKFRIRLCFDFISFSQLFFRFRFALISSDILTWVSAKKSTILEYSHLSVRGKNVTTQDYSHLSVLSLKCPFEQNPPLLSRHSHLKSEYRLVAMVFPKLLKLEGKETEFSCWMSLEGKEAESASLGGTIRFSMKICIIYVFSQNSIFRFFHKKSQRMSLPSSVAQG